MHVNVIQALRNVAYPRFFVLGRRRDEVNRVSRSGLAVDKDLKVAIIGVHRIGGI